MSAGAKKVKPIDYDSKDNITTRVFVKKLEELGDSGMVAEYARICSENPASTFEAFHKNADKNRHADVWCYDKRRIILATKNKSDYIHANYVDGYRHKCGFICTQAPLLTTQIDFWEMVWQEGCVVIVSLTRLIEHEKDKRAPYWPLPQWEAVKYGRFRVTTAKIVDAEDRTYAVSDIILEHPETGEKRSLKHLLYLHWPDGGVPTHTSEVLRFRDIMREHNKEATANALHWRLPQEPPIVVHCDTGVGATGTLVALDILLQQREQTGKFDVPGVVQKIRQQRYQSIQKSEQYFFLNLCIIEYAIKTIKKKEGGATLDGSLPQEESPDSGTGTKETKSYTAMI